MFLFIRNLKPVPSWRFEGGVTTMGFTGNIKGSDAMMINWLSAIRSYVDLVQSVGHSQLNPSPLLADGFDVLTHQPVVWEFPDGHHTPISNFASQQTGYGHWMPSAWWLRIRNITSKPGYKAAILCSMVSITKVGFLLGWASFPQSGYPKTEGPASKTRYMS